MDNKRYLDLGGLAHFKEKIDDEYVNEEDYITNGDIDEILGIKGDGTGSTIPSSKSITYELQLDNKNLTLVGSDDSKSTVNIVGKSDIEEIWSFLETIGEKEPEPEPDDKNVIFNDTNFTTGSVGSTSTYIYVSGMRSSENTYNKRASSKSPHAFFLKEGETFTLRNNNTAKFAYGIMVFDASKTTITNEVNFHHTINEYGDVYLNPSEEFVAPDYVGGSGQTFTITDISAKIYDGGWQENTEESTYVATMDCYVFVNVRMKNWGVMESSDFALMNEAFEMIIDRNRATTGATAPVDIIESSERNALIASINIEYGRFNNEASYYFVRIPRYDINGKLITPKVALTSEDGSIDGKKYSALDFAKRQNTAICCNASLFNTGSKVVAHKHVPEGQLIINGVDMTMWKVDANYSGDLSKFNNYWRIDSADVDYGSDKWAWTDANGNSVDAYPWMVSDMGAKIGDNECYPLLIDENGNFQTLSTENRKSDDYLPANLIANGYKYACTGWGRIVYNYANDGLDTDDIVHKGKYIRQAVGQFQNGDYFILSVDKTGYSGATAPQVNEAGCNYATIADFCIAKGVRIAYSLDGGGSCETVLGNRSVNPIFDGMRGRAVPTVIYWS